VQRGSALGLSPCAIPKAVVTCLLPAGYFLFRPTQCMKCHGTAITETVVKTQALDYITAGVAMTGGTVLWLLQLVRW
jgi:hypothetical protein